MPALINEHRGGPVARQGAIKAFSYQPASSFCRLYLVLAQVRSGLADLLVGEGKGRRTERHARRQRPIFGREETLQDVILTCKSRNTSLDAKAVSSRLEDNDGFESTKGQIQSGYVFDRHDGCRRYSAHRAHRDVHLKI